MIKENVDVFEVPPTALQLAGLEFEAHVDFPVSAEGVAAMRIVGQRSHRAENNLREEVGPGRGAGR